MAHMDDAAGEGNALCVVLGGAGEHFGGEVLELDRFGNSTGFVEAIHVEEMEVKGKLGRGYYIGLLRDDYREAERQETEEFRRKRTLITLFPHRSRQSPIAVITPPSSPLPTFSLARPPPPTYPRSIRGRD
jgi:hypothetical protein